MNNLCYHIKLLQLFPRLFYLHTPCYFINSCGLINRRLINLLSSSQPFLIYSLLTPSTHLINEPAQHTKPHSPHSQLIVRTFSPPIQLSNSTGVFDHRAVLIGGDRGMAGGFSLMRKKENLLTESKFWKKAKASESYAGC